MAKFYIAFIHESYLSFPGWYTFLFFFLLFICSVTIIKVSVLGPFLWLVWLFLGYFWFVHIVWLLFLLSLSLPFVFKAFDCNYILTCLFFLIFTILIVKSWLSVKLSSLYVCLLVVNFKIIFFAHFFLG